MISSHYASPPVRSSTGFHPKIARPTMFPATPLESTLLQVFIPLHFNSLRINAYKKPGGGPPLSLTRNPTKVVCPERSLVASDLSLVPRPKVSSLSERISHPPTRATDAPGSKVASTIRRFSATDRRRRGSLLRTARSEGSTYSPSGHFPMCPLGPSSLTQQNLSRRPQVDAYQLNNLPSFEP